MPDVVRKAAHVYDVLAAALQQAEESLDHNDVVIAIQRFGMVRIPCPHEGPNVDDRFEYRDAAGDSVTMWCHLDNRNAHAPRSKFVLELRRADSDRHRVTKVSFPAT
ncbi:hypothetical protein [Cupriavidus pauculus]|uniref:Uncharacterized protein n=1 Tax=Cupriavidus pauculus TaxID=82633 RepID=A0A3G8HA41_9BURK|nr:hypothetical protein [Cupriavidus pauculus]AZG17145.1 hypothetical protein EHF44_27115 [Cupriavidus pauculus]